MSYFSFPTFHAPHGASPEVAAQIEKTALRARKAGDVTFRTPVYVVRPEQCFPVVGFFGTAQKGSA
jgi:hypothetical protein